MESVLLLALAAYSAGSIPSAYWIGKVFYGKDLREHGSSNLGATNALRVLGWRAAVPVVLVDVFKGFASAWWFPLLDGHAGAWPTVLYGGAAVVGHVFSLWVRFRGGKGVATAAGALVAISPMAVAVGVLAWLAALIALRTVSVASMVAALAVGLAGLVIPGTDTTAQIFLGSIAVFVVWAHRSNIRRLIAGTESRIGGRRGEGGG